MVKGSSREVKSRPDIECPTIFGGNVKIAFFCCSEGVGVVVCASNDLRWFT